MAAEQGAEFAPAADVMEKVKMAIILWASPDADLGWPGSPEVADHAEELAGYLWEADLLKES